MKKIITSITICSAVLLLAAGCKRSSSDPVPNYTIPTTYNFSNANFADATTRLGMYTEMSGVMKTALTGPISATTLKNMFSNTNSPFATATYNTSGVQIKDQGAALYKTDVPNFIDSLVKASSSNQPASRGITGVGTSSANAATKYALTGLGVNYAQVFNKGTMGGLVTYQIVTTMDAIAKLSIDNTTVVNGETAMEHAWDMAFGYWGVPVNFPTNKTGVKLWGSYTTQVDSGFHANKILMDAFLKGRAAISAKDKATITAQATIIMNTMERLTGAAVLQEINEIKASISDNVARNSRLSECYGFVYSLKYNPKKVITDAQINTILALFPKNFWDLTITDVNNIQAAVATQYNFVSVQDIL
ncbi:MAG: hypothetical protein JWP37_3547 [Mucilaginibacter sp.]|nr:hypothetical protein [Mucilaginibacter sp.]